MSRVEIYYVHIPDDITPRDLEEYIIVLDDMEQATYRKYRVDFKKLEFLIGRLLLKTILGRRLAVPPVDIGFTVNQYGKLFLSERHAAFEVYFNLSHTDHLVACAVSEDFPVGIDVERTDRHALEVMTQVFTPKEIAFVLAHSSVREQQTAFYLIWTRKEAVMKAAGKGFSLNPLSFSVPLQSGQAQDKAFNYLTLDLTGQYLCSVASPCAGLTPHPEYETHILLHSDLLKS